MNGNTLKLCTFKVGEYLRGRNLGERLLCCAFKYAIEHNIPYIYLHIFGKEHDMLVSLCQDYGFVSVGKYHRDNVYLKEMLAPVSAPTGMNPLSYAIKYYPHYLDIIGVGKFIVPIQPKYHNDLFPDISDIAGGLFANDLDQYNPQSNTMKKAYICHANTMQLHPGDLLLFYRSGDRRNIETIGVVEQTYRGQDVDIVLSLVSKRTVYSRKMVAEILRKKSLVILFRFIGTIPPVSQKNISEAGIKIPIQSIRKITHEQYLQCFSKKLN